MIAIGIGARSDVLATEILAAVAHIEGTVLQRADVLGTFADAPFLAQLRDAAGQTARISAALPIEDLRARSAECQTTSERALAAFDVTSVAEASALAAAGPGSKLIVPRLIFGPVTVAAAASADHPSVHP